MRLAWVPIVLSACTSSPCDLERLEGTPTAGPGELRHGFAAGETAQLAPTASGVACLTCGTMVYLDGALNEQRRVGVAVAGAGSVASGGDTAFVFDDDRGLSPDFGDDRYRPPHFQLFALSATGHELWRNDLGQGEDWTGYYGRVDLDGPVHASAAFAAGPRSVVVYGFPLASVFDPGTGKLSWTTPVAYGDAVVPDATGGLLIASGENKTGPGNPHATLRHLDAAGTLTWTVTWTTTDVPPASGGNITIMGATRTADGGFVVAGKFDTATLALGGQVLQGPTQPSGIARTNFVAAVDSGGTTQWAFAAGGADSTGYIDHLKLAAGGDAMMICGDHAGSGQLGLPATGGPITAFVARIDAGGLLTPYPIVGGGGDEVGCQALAAAADGSAVVLVEAQGDAPRGTLHVGSKTFDRAQQVERYVLNLAL